MVISWNLSVLYAYKDDILIESVGPEDRLWSTYPYNKFILGASNKNRKSAEGVVDEMQFWDQWKSDEFISQLYDSYQYFVSITNMVIIGNRVSIVPITEEPQEIVPPVMIYTHDPCGQISHCHSKCSLLPWYAFTVWDGALCKIYNVFNTT